MELNEKRKSIITQRLILRPLKKDDINAVHYYASDEDVCKFMPWGPNSLKESKNFIKKAIKKRKKKYRLYRRLCNYIKKHK